MKQTSITENSTFLQSKLIIGILFLSFLLISNRQLSAQTLWYYNGTGALNSTSSWGTSTDGTGGTLTSFTTGGRYFIIQNTTAVSLSGVWNIGTTNFANAGGDSLIIGNPSTPGAAITLTLLSGSSLIVNKSKTISVSVPSSGNHKLIYQNSGNGLSFGAIYDPNFELVFDGATVTSNSTNSFGNLSLINNANVNMGGANAKFRNITVDAGSTLSGPIGASSNFIAVRSGGVVTINGTFKAGKQGGLATTTGTGAFTGTVTTTANSSTITTSGAITTASTVGLTQTVTCASTAGLSVGSYITVTSGTGAFPALTYIKAITSSTKFTASVAATTALSGATLSTTLYSLPCASSTSVTTGGAVTLVSGTGTFAGSTTVIGIPNSTTIALSATPTSTIQSGATVQVAFTASTSWSTLVFEDAVANITLGSSSTIDFYRGTSGQLAAQTVDTLSYANLVLSNSGFASNKSFIAGIINVSGSFTVNSLLGTITQPSATTINFTGSSAQTIPSQLTTFSVLGISGGTKTLSGNISITSSLNLTSGVLNTTSADTVTVTSAGTVSRISGWVFGNLNRNIGTGTAVARVFHIGDATNYTPITLTFASVTTAGNLTASTGTPISSVANYGTAPISSSAYVNRYWNVSNANNSALAFTTYDAAMTYVSGDLVGGATAASVIAARYNSGWTTNTTTAGTLSNTIPSLSTLATSFILGNCANPVTPSVSIGSTTTTFCTGTSATFTATPTNGGSAPTYQWKKNGNNISGATSVTLNLTNTDVANGDIITCVMTANNLCQTTATATSNGLTLTVGVSVTPTVSISTALTTICLGSSVTFSATPVNPGSGPTYQWKLNGNNVGTNSTSYNSSSLSNNDVVTCVMTANNVCQTSATATSNGLTMNITSPVTPTVSIAADVNNVCANTAVNITATPTNGGTTPNYNFKVNGVSKQNGAGSTYQSFNFANNDVVSCVITRSDVCANTANSNPVAMTIKSTPAAPLITGGAIQNCTVGTSTDLYANAWAGTWSSSNPSVATVSTGSTGSNSVKVNAVGNGSTTISFTLSNPSSGCASVASTPYAVTSVVVSPIVCNSSACVSGATFNATNSTDITGLTAVWATENNRVSISNTGVVTPGTSPGSGLISYTVSNSSTGCSAKVFKAITINALPAIPTVNVVPSIGASGAICPGRDYQFTGTPSGGVWATTATAGVATLSPTGLLHTVGAGSATLSYTSPANANVNGCTNKRTFTGTVLAGCFAREANPTTLSANTSINLFPNPARGVVNLKVDRLIGEGTVVITDIYGKSIKNYPLRQAQGDNQVLNISNLSKGIYLVNVITSEGKITKKLIVD